MKARYWIVLTFWLILLGGFYTYSYQSQQGVSQLLSSWLRNLAHHPLSAMLLLLIYLIRPVVLLPITILTVFTGFLYGPWLGGIYALLATLLSSSLAYMIGRFFNQDLTLQRHWITALQQRSFETVLTSRLIFLPGDLVNYVCGFLRISYPAFIFATALGGLPGLLVGILAGASIQGQFDFTSIVFKPWYLVMSVILLVLSLWLSNVLRKRSYSNHSRFKSLK